MEKPLGERIASLEAKVQGQQDWMRDIDAKLDKLVAAANMGRGAWWAMVKLGGLLVMAAMAAAWVYDRLPPIKH